MNRTMAQRATDVETLKQNFLRLVQEAGRIQISYEEILATCGPKSAHRDDVSSAVWGVVDHDMYGDDANYRFPDRPIVSYLGKPFTPNIYEWRGWGATHGE